MTSKEKTIAKKLLGQCILRIIEDNKKSSDKNAISSIRKLAAASGVEYSIIQKITSGKKDPQFTTLLALAEAFNLSVSKLLSGYIE